ncbi:MAG TPA: hypothetical protein VFW96_16505 [Thermomicrobiales bacterium]|nr:hypothetical protein [Thermomicrobiales bacterium]
MSHQPDTPGAPGTPAERYATIVATLLGDAGVAYGTSGQRGFGAAALTVKGKIFAMLASGDRFVVKLPRRRADALVASGAGERFDPGHGRLMKEWLVVAPASADEWLPLAREALAFVGGRDVGA